MSDPEACVEPLPVSGETTSSSTQAGETATDPAVPTASVSSGVASQGDVCRIMAEISTAKGLLDANTSPLTDEERAQLSLLIGQAEQSLASFVELQNQGAARVAGMAPLALAGGVIIADDATVVGIADDPLLILVGMGMLAVWMATAGPASNRELQHGWEALTATIERMVLMGTTLVALRLKGEQLRGNTKQLAIHLARLLALGSLAGMSSGEPPGNGDDDGHWWTEIKAFLKNIRKALGGASRKQAIRELIRKGTFTEEAILALERALVKAAEKMGEPPPPFLP